MLEQRIFALWGKYVRKHLGVPLSIKTVPISLSNGILKIYTEFPAYKTTLSYRKSEIMTDINAELGQPALTDFRIEIHPVRSAELREDATEDQSSDPETLKENATIGNTQITREQIEEIEQTLASVSDPHLRESLWQLFTTQSEDES